MILQTFLFNFNPLEAWCVYSSILTPFNPSSVIQITNGNVEIYGNILSIIFIYWFKLLEFVFF